MVISSFHDAVWIEALFNLSALTRDARSARRAVARSLELLETDPDFLTTHYNLACAYAVLGKHRSAREHLETCVEGDESYRSKIEKDPILADFRRTGEYAALLESGPVREEPEIEKRPAP
jgi:hypothetical protein